MQGYIQRYCFPSTLCQMKRHLIEAFLSPRQLGKSALAKKIQNKIKKSVYLDFRPCFCPRPRFHEGKLLWGYAEREFSLSLENGMLLKQKEM